MKTSVLMSVYKNDHPDFLKLALQSIYEDQTVKPDEIVIVIDGPVGAEITETLEAFASDKRDVVRCYPQEKNMGLGEALRIGAGKCTGDYIFRMDSDDVSCPTRFEQQLAFLEAHPEVDAVGGSIGEFEEDFHKIVLNRCCPETQGEILRTIRKRNPMNHVTACIRRVALEKAGGYLPMTLMEDYYLWARMVANGCILSNMPETLVWVRIGAGFASRRGAKGQIRSRYLIQKYLHEHKLLSMPRLLVNMLVFSCFIYCPPGLKGWIYRTILHKKVQD
jgi:glycosyltransferase involved in cell wall biosynthesis